MSSSTTSLTTSSRSRIGGRSAAWGRCPAKRSRAWSSGWFLRVGQRAQANVFSTAPSVENDADVRRAALDRGDGGQGPGHDQHAGRQRAAARRPACWRARRRRWQGCPGPSRRAPRRTPRRPSRGRPFRRAGPPRRWAASPCRPARCVPRSRCRRRSPGRGTSSRGCARRRSRTRRSRRRSRSSTSAARDPRSRQVAAEADADLGLDLGRDQLGHGQAAAASRGPCRPGGSRTSNREGPSCRARRCS